MTSWYLRTNELNHYKIKQATNWRNGFVMYCTFNVSRLWEASIMDKLHFQKNNTKNINRIGLVGIQSSTSLLFTCINILCDILPA